MSGDLSDAAKEAAAKATGLRPDQVERAVAEYRKAASALYIEPQWTALMHMSFSNSGGIHQYIDPEEQTRVVLQIETSKKDQIKVYVFGGTGYEQYGEARSAELNATSRPRPYSL